MLYIDWAFLVEVCAPSAPCYCNDDEDDFSCVSVNNNDNNLSKPA